MAEPSTATSCRARKASSGSTIHGSMGSEWPGPTAPGSASKAPATSGSHRTSRRRKVPSTVSLDGQPRGRRILAALERGDDAARGAVHARAAAQIGQRLGARLGQRRQQGAVLALDGALEQRLGHRAGAGAQDPPAASVVARGRHDADPAPLDGGQPGVDLGAGGQLREAIEHLGDVDPRPVVDGRPPLARVPVEAPLRDAPHGGDDLRVVGEGEDNDRPAVGATPQLDVGAFLDELHPPSR